jgi:hypothetical protein
MVSRRIGGLAGCGIVVAALVASFVATSRPTSAAAAVAPGQDHACMVGSPPRHGIDWSALRNPVLSFPTVGVKDQALQWSGGAWHMLYSDMVETAAPPHVRFAVAISSSPDLRHWTAPHIVASNAASPDIVRSPSGEFIVTYQTPAGLEYRTSSSTSLTSWSGPHPLAHGLAGRMIDGALAFVGHGVILGFKAGTTTQHFEIAWAPTLAGPFHLVGRPNIAIYNDTVENYEFLTVGPTWRLIATSNTLDQPFIFTLNPGNPAVPATWLHWDAGRELALPSQPFNTGTGISSVGFEHANSAFLCVGPRDEDYLTYAGSSELTMFGGWGHARIGVARSTDLVTWDVPPA